MRWAPVTPQVHFVSNSSSSRSSSSLASPLSPPAAPLSPLSAVLVCNHTAIVPLLSQLLRQYERMRKVGAYVEAYRQQGGLFKENLDEFDDAREVLRSLIDDYQAAQAS